MIDDLKFEFEIQLWIDLLSCLVLEIALSSWSVDGAHIV